MGTVTLTQFSFNRGELDPALHCRGDWKYYRSGAEKLKNLICRPQGAAVKRGGLRLVAPALDDDAPSRLVPFRFSVGQSYMLEFSDRSMRVLKDGGVVTYPEGHPRAGEEVVVATPYPAGDLPQIRHAQTSDVMILTHPAHPPRRLSRHAHHDWRFSRLMQGNGGGRPSAPEGLMVTESGGNMARYVVTAVTEDNGESPPSDAVTAWNAGGVRGPAEESAFSVLYNWLAGRDSSRLPAETNFAAMTAAELVAFLRGCGYVDNGRGVHTDVNGTWWEHRSPDGNAGEVWWNDREAGNLGFLIEECLCACDRGWAGDVRTPMLAAIRTCEKEENSDLAGTGVTGLEWDPADSAGFYRVYRDLAGDGMFSPVGETADTVFIDANLPAQTGGLPAESDLFSAPGDYPAVCAFFEQRLILARSDNRPTTFWGSDTGAYNSFTRSTPAEDTDSYEFTLSSGEMNEIQWIVPLNEMLLGTSGGEWKAGGGDRAITPGNINARLQSWYGCAAAAAVAAGRTVLFAGRARRTIRNFAYSLEADGYSGRDLTAHAGHLFAGRTVTGMCHQQEPHGIVWAVMSDGGLLSCAYAPDEDVVAWSRHGTRGRFESAASLADTDGTDQIYFCVAREIGGRTRRFIETLADADDGFFLDCGLTYRGAPANRAGGLGHLEGEKVSCLADGCVFPNLEVRDGGITLPDGFRASVIHAGLPYTAELATLEMEPEAGESLRNRARFAVSASVRFLNTRECHYSHSDGMLSEMKFRADELPGRAGRPFSGEKNIIFSSPPGARTTRLRLISRAPTPFTVLAIVMEAGYGQPA